MTMEILMRDRQGEFIIHNAKTIWKSWCCELGDCYVVEFKDGSREKYSIGENEICEVAMR